MIKNMNVANKCIYIVATPIGSLHDVSCNVKNILIDVDVIFCEDTRVTVKLLQYLNITNKLISLHEYNEKNKINDIINDLITNKYNKIAIVSDAGTPCISDPGRFLINEAHKNHIQIKSIPGPSALTSALASSGFIQPRHIFSGFLSKTIKEKEEEFFKWYTINPCIAIFFESPYRLIDTLIEIKNYFGENIEICISREISKIYEEHIRDNVTNIINFLQLSNKVMGEFVVCVNVTANIVINSSIFNKSLSEILQEIHTNINKNNKTKLKDIIRDYAKKYHINSKHLYNEYNKLHIENTNEIDNNNQH